MPSGGSNPGQRRGGRQKGARNKATIEKALIAEQVIARAEMRGQKLAKEVLNDFMKLFAGMAAAYQPIPRGQPIPQDRAPSEPMFEKYARLAVDTAHKLAPYQSPTFRSVVVAPAPDTNRLENRNRLLFSMLDGTNGAPRDAIAASRVYRRIVAGGRG